MKTILLIFALLFAHQSIAVAPYGFKGQDQTATQYSNVLKFKNRSVVKTGGINSLVEDQDNLLYNGGFEATPDLDGWTCVGAGSSFTVESKPVSASVVISGDRTLAIGCATVGGCTCTQDFSVNQQQVGRSVLLSGIVRTSSDVQGLKLTYRENGADTSVTTENVLNGIPATEAVIGSSATTIGIKLTIPYSSTLTTVRVDEIKMAYGTAVTNQPAIGQRIFYTPTTQGLGVITPASNACSYTQIGPSILLECKLSGATISSTELRIGLPAGMTIASGFTGYREFNDASRDGTTGVVYTIIGQSGNTYINMGRVTGVSNPLSPGLAADLVGTNQNISFSAIVPISELASSVPTYTGRCNDPRACENVFSAKVSAASPAIVSDENLDWLDGDCTRSGSSNSLATCSFKTGIFTVAPNCSVTTDVACESAGCNVGGYIETISTTQIQIRTSGPTNYFSSPVSIICTKQGQDYLNAKTLQQNVALKSYVQTPNTTGKVGFCSAKISATGVISDQLGGCFASCTNATTPVCTFTSNYWKSGSVPNCWHKCDGNTTGDSIQNTSTASGLCLSSGTIQAGSRAYFCHGEIQ